MAKSKIAKNSLNSAAIALAISPERLQDALDGAWDKSFLELERDRALENMKWHEIRLNQFASKVVGVLSPMFNGGKLSKEEISELFQHATNLSNETKSL